MPSDDLYRLVGVPTDAPIERLRTAYEQAVGAATRSGDHQRALQLSTAFDALPSSVKAQVYRNSRHGAGPVDPWYRSDAYSGDAPVRDRSASARRGRRPGRRTRRRRPPRPRAGARAVLRNLFLLAAVATVTGFVVYMALFDRSGAQ
jgi:hypothetical protein